MRVVRAGLCLWLALASLAAAQQQQRFWWWGLVAPDPDSSAQPPTVSGDGSGPAGGGTTAGENVFDESTYTPCFCPNGGEGKSCLCVVYGQCIDGSIDVSGTDLVDNRFNVLPVEKCSGLQVCCEEPPPEPGTQITNGSVTILPITNPPITNPPITNPPITNPPITNPPITNPPITNPPIINPPTASPPIPNTPIAKPPIIQKPIVSGCGIRRGQSPPSDNSTLFGEFPWMLAVFEATYVGSGEPTINIFNCGASLVHPQVALTAAHCIKGSQPAGLRVRAGEWDLTQDSESIPYQERNVIKIIRHPKFAERSLHNNIALLVLDKIFSPEESVNVICLPQPEADFTGLRCIATGWGTGTTGKKSLQKILRKVEIPIVDHNACQTNLRRTRLGRYYKLDRSFICAGGDPNVDTCTGTLPYKPSNVQAVHAEDYTGGNPWLNIGHPSTLQGSNDKQYINANHQGYPVGFDILNVPTGSHKDNSPYHDIHGIFPHPYFPSERKPHTHIAWRQWPFSYVPEGTRKPHRIHPYFQERESLMHDTKPLFDERSKLIYNGNHKYHDESHHRYESPHMHNKKRYIGGGNLHRHHSEAWSYGINWKHQHTLHRNQHSNAWNRNYHEITPLYGDGGGPLVCPIANDDGRYVQVGIISGGIGCGYNMIPGLYTDVSYLRDWIDQQLEDNGIANVAVPSPRAGEVSRTGDATRGAEQ